MCSGTKCCRVGLCLAFLNGLGYAASSVATIVVVSILWPVYGAWILYVLLSVPDKCFWCASLCLWFFVCVVLHVCGFACVWFWMVVVLDVGGLHVCVFRCGCWLPEELVPCYAFGYLSCHDMFVYCSIDLWKICWSWSTKAGAAWMIEVPAEQPSL